MYLITTNNPNCLYSFKTKDEVNYGVNLSRRIEDLTKAEIIFGITDSELFNVRYNIQNSNDVYSIMDTVSECIRLFIKSHPDVTEYSFEGSGDEQEKIQRNSIYLEKYIPKIFQSDWEVKNENNRIVITKK